MKRTHGLSQREEEVVELLLQGKSNKQIAAALHISERTVEFHLKNIYAKCKVNSRVELILELGKSTGDFAENPVESTVAGEGMKSLMANRLNRKAVGRNLRKRLLPRGKRSLPCLPDIDPFLSS